MMLRVLAVLGLTMGACSPQPRTEPREPERTADGRKGDDRIVAFLNGEPVTWRQVAERALELEFKRNIDLYVRWRILESLREKHGIENPPSDLTRRADAMIAQYMKAQGEEVFHKQLELEGFTEKSYRDYVLKNRLFVEKLTLEKMVRYSYFQEGWIEIDRFSFTEAADAEAFHGLAKAKGYDKAADEYKTSKGRSGRRPREVFLRDLPPTDLDPAILERLFAMSDGTTTGIEQSRQGVHHVIHVRKRVSARTDSYASLKDRIFEWILEDPPADAELAGWIDLQLKRSKIEYADRGTQGN